MKKINILEWILNDFWITKENLKIVSLYRNKDWFAQIEFFRENNRELQTVTLDKKESSKISLLNILKYFNRNYEWIKFVLFNSENIFWLNHCEIQQTIWNKNIVEDFFISLMFSNICSSRDWKSFEEVMLSKKQPYEEYSFWRLRTFLFESFTKEFESKDVEKDSLLLMFYFDFINWIMNKNLFKFNDKLEYFHFWKRKWVKSDSFIKINPVLNSEYLRLFTREDWKVEIKWMNTEAILDISTLLQNDKILLSFKK